MLVPRITYYGGFFDQGDRNVRLAALNLKGDLRVNPGGSQGQNR